MAVDENVLYFDGKYNPDRRFVIHNWTNEDVKSFWDGRPIFIKVGDMYECDHAIARKLTKEIVDREMFKVAEEQYKAAGGGEKAFAEKVRERAEMAVLSRELRKPYEDKTISEIRPGEENPIMARMREEIRAEERALRGENTASDAAAGIPGISNEKAVSRVKGEFEE